VANHDSTRGRARDALVAQQWVHVVGKSTAIDGMHGNTFSCSGIEEVFKNLLDVTWHILLCFVYVGSILVIRSAELFQSSARSYEIKILARGTVILSRVRCVASLLFNSTHPTCTTWFDSFDSV